MRQRYDRVTNVVQVFSRASVCLLALGLAALRGAARFAWSRIIRQPEMWQAQLGQSLAELCESLGTTYIKFGQLLSTRYDLFPAAVLRPLERLQDRVAPFDSRLVPAILREQLGRPPSEVFASFEPQPVSSASVACVYRATLHDGQTVAVKIRRPGVLRMVAIDLQLMRWGAQQMGRLPAFRTVPMVEVIDELGEAIAQQLDFRREAENNRRFREHFVDNPQVRLPALVDEYCTDTILVMEFLPDLTHINELYRQGLDCQTSITTGLKALYQMMFIDGLIHCDLHPGNMYFQPDGHVTFLDTGFVKEFSQEDRVLFAKFFFGIATKGGKQCAKITYDMALSVPPDFDYDEFERAICALVARTTGSRAANFQVAGFAMQLFDIQRRFGLRSTPNFIMAILSLLVYEGIIKTYYAELDFQREAVPFLLKAIVPQRPKPEGDSQSVSVSNYIVSAPQAA